MAENGPRGAETNYPHVHRQKRHEKYFLENRTYRYVKRTLVEKVENREKEFIFETYCPLFLFEFRIIFGHPQKISLSPLCWSCAMHSGMHGCGGGSSRYSSSSSPSYPSLYAQARLCTVLQYQSPM